MTITKYDAISQMTVLAVLVFGPEPVSYERSRHETAAKFHHLLVRVFFEIMISRFPVFPGSQVIKMVRFPVFPVSQVIKIMFFKISRFASQKRSSVGTPN